VLQIGHVKIVIFDEKKFSKKFSGSLFFLIFGHQNPVSVFHPDSLETLDPYHMNLVHSCGSDGGIEGPPSLPHPPSVIQNNTLIVEKFFPGASSSGQEVQACCSCRQ
jgi:hypothetical protein